MLVTINYKTKKLLLRRHELEIQGVCSKYRNSCFNQSENDNTDNIYILCFAHASNTATPLVMFHST